MLKKSGFWRLISISVGLLLIISVVINLSGLYQVPQQFTLFLFGSLVSIGIAYSIVNPVSSLARLTAKEEAHFQKRQFIVSLLVSVVLGLSMLAEEVRSSVIIWLFLPIIFLPGFLWLNAQHKRKQ